jgi:hydrogenase maturation factor
MTAGPAEGSRPQIDCALCRDAGTVGVVLALAPAERSASVQFGTEVLTVAMDLLDAVAVGDSVLVHQGFAIQRLEPQ